MTRRNVRRVLFAPPFVDVHVTIHFPSRRHHPSRAFRVSSMRHRIARSTLAACSAIAFLGIVFAGARRARRGEYTLVAPTHDTPDEPREPAPLNLRAALRAVRSSPARFRAAAARERSDALSRRKQDFLGLLSHELRNPLSAIH